jgi:preprotein translocase subunit SecG
MLFSILLAVMVILGIVLIVLILLQQGKGADAGAAFGSGASGTVFGARGSSSFLSRTTGVLMAIFMILAVAMAWLGQHGGASQPSSIMAGGNKPAAAAAATAQVGTPARQVAPSAPATTLPSPQTRHSPAEATGEDD